MDGERVGVSALRTDADARIVVVGSSGAGKTSLARRLAAQLGVPHIELDALHFAEDWIEVPDALFASASTLSPRPVGGSSMATTRR